MDHHDIFKLKKSIQHIILQRKKERKVKDNKNKVKEMVQLFLSYFDDPSCIRLNILQSQFVCE